MYASAPTKSASPIVLPTNCRVRPDVTQATAMKMHRTPNATRTHGASEESAMTIEAAPKTADMEAKSHLAPGLKPSLIFCSAISYSRIERPAPQGYGSDHGRRSPRGGT